jgi:hypothetical protein
VELTIKQRGIKRVEKGEGKKQQQAEKAVG